MTEINEHEYEGKIEIIGKRTSEDPCIAMTPYDVVVKFDGKTIPFLKNCDVWLSVDKEPMVVLKFTPTELEIKLDDAEVFVRRHKNWEVPP